MKIVQVASEFAPFVREGNLGEIVAGLAKALARLDHRVDVFIPGYRCVLEHPALAGAVRSLELSVEMDDHYESGEVLQVNLDENVRLNLVCRDEYFDRSGVYGGRRVVYDDNAARFIFFSKAVAEAIFRMGFPVDIVHCHDWTAALTPLYLRYYEERRQQTSAAKTVFTLHDTVFQGLYPARTLELMNLSEAVFTAEGIEFYGQVNFLKAGLVCGDKLTTVSRAYRDETLGQAAGNGLEGVLAARADDYVGVTCGIDTELWNPAADASLPACYSAKDQAGRLECRRALLRELGFDPEFDGPVFFLAPTSEDAVTRRLVARLGDFVKFQRVLFVSGRGVSGLDPLLESVRAEAPHKVRLVDLDDGLRRRCMAGADFYLVARGWLPCGISQQVAQRYGSVPVVPRLGGLIDTVTDFRVDPAHGTGLIFDPVPQDMAETLHAAVRMHRSNAAGMARLRTLCMKRDSSWDEPAKTYEALYKKLVYGREL